MQDLQAQLTAAAAVAFIIQWLKNSKYFPWLSSETAKLNRIAAVIGSGLATFGISAHYANHTLVISNLDVRSIAHFAWVWFQSFVMSHGAYKYLFAGAGTGAIGNGKPTNGGAH